MAKKNKNGRTNLWDYLVKVAEERTERVEARNQTTQQRIEAGTDINAIVKDAVSEYGDDVIGLALSAAGAAAGVPIPPSMGSSSSATTAAPAGYRAPTSRVGGGRPISRATGSGLPSWLPWAAGALGLGLVLRGRS